MCIAVHSTCASRMFLPTLVQKAMIPARSESRDIVIRPPLADMIGPVGAGEVVGRYHLGSDRALGSQPLQWTDARNLTGAASYRECGYEEQGPGHGHGTLEFARG